MSRYVLGREEDVIVFVCTPPVHNHGVYTSFGDFGGFLCFGTCIDIGTGMGEGRELAMICYMGRRIRDAENLLLYYSVTLRRIAGEEQ